MKKVFSVVLVVALVLTFAACGVAAHGGYAGGSYNLKMGHYWGSAQNNAKVMENFSAVVSEMSDGKIEVDVYPDGQMGHLNELAEYVSMGTIDFAPNDWPTLATILGYNKGALVGFAYMFKDFAHVGAFFGSDIYAQMKQDILDQYNIRVLGSFGEGFRQVYTQRPVNSVADFAGLRLRVPDVAVYMETFQAYGAATTIVPGAEIYT